MLGEDFRHTSLISKHGNKGKPGYVLLHPGKLMPKTYRTPQHEKRITRIGALMQAGNIDAADQLFQRLTNLTPSDRKYIAAQIQAARGRKVPAKKPAKGKGGEQQPVNPAADPTRTPQEDTQTPAGQSEAASRPDTPADTQEARTGGLDDEQKRVLTRRIMAADTPEELDEIESELSTQIGEDDPDFWEMQDLINAAHRRQFERDRDNRRLDDRDAPAGAPKGWVKRIDAVDDVADLDALYEEFEGKFRPGSPKYEALIPEFERKAAELEGADPEPAPVARTKPRTTQDYIRDIGAATSPDEVDEIMDRFLEDHNAASKGFNNVVALATTRHENLSNREPALVMGFVGPSGQRDLPRTGTSDAPDVPLRDDIRAALRSEAARGGHHAAAAQTFLELSEQYPNAGNLLDPVEPIRFQMRTDDGRPSKAEVRATDNGLQLVIYTGAIHEGYSKAFRNMQAGRKETWSVSNMTVDSADVTFDDYIRSVSTHEFGHVTHFLMTASDPDRRGEHRNPEDVITDMMGRDEVDWDSGTVKQGKGYGADGLPFVSQYARENDAEKYAEWFAGYTLGRLNARQQASEDFMGRFRDAMKRRAEFDQSQVVAKTARDSRSLCSGLEDEAAEQSINEMAAAFAARRMQREQARASVEKAAYRLKTVETNAYAGHVYTDDNGNMVSFKGEFPPTGYEEGRHLAEWLKEQQRYEAERDESEEPEVAVEIDTTEQARQVGTAVGSALVASGLISKADEEQQIVYGWAYVTHDKDGNVVVDKSGEFVDEIAEIEKAAVQFMINSRNTDAHHTNVKSGTIVESMVFTPEKIEKMGIPAGVMPSGWWIGTKVDDATWAQYKAGLLKAFSVHGRGTRKAVED